MCQNVFSVDPRAIFVRCIRNDVVARDLGRGRESASCRKAQGRATASAGEDVVGIVREGAGAVERVERGIFRLDAPAVVVEEGARRLAGDGECATRA